jgi:hypothetical protein
VGLGCAAEMLAKSRTAMASATFFMNALLARGEGEMPGAQFSRFIS